MDRNEEILIIAQRIRGLSEFNGDRTQLAFRLEKIQELANALIPRAEELVKETPSADPMILEFEAKSRRGKTA